MIQKKKFSDAISANISVVGGLIVNTRDQYTLEPNVEVQITERSGLYYLSYVDNLSLLVTVNYNSYETLGKAINQLSFRIEAKKLYVTNTGSNSITIGVKMLAKNY